MTSQTEEMRPATRGDDAAVLALLRATMGWDEGGHDEAFFWWKHRENPFGESPAWVFVADGEIVGYRTFLRWRFVDDSGRSVSTVRAVDTVTHPDHRGRGIFRRLTLQAVADRTLAGDGWVFNTPNDQSRPGYLTMGWSINRRLPVGALPAGARAAARMRSARAAASLWSEPTSAGVDAASALADPAFAAGLLSHAPTRGVRTQRTPEYLRWRTSFEPLRYRVLLAHPDDPAAGGLVFRVRRRGEAREAAIIEALVPDVRTGFTLVRRVLADAGADYAIGLRGGPAIGLLPVPRLGPILTTRPLAGTPPAPGDWALTLGDIELF